MHVQRFMAKYEFCSPYTLCCSDSEPLTMSEALELADQECRNMWAPSKHSCRLICTPACLSEHVMCSTQ